MQMLEEAEIEAEKEESEGKSRSITINAVYETPNPNLLKDCHIEGRIWVLMWLEEILEFGLEITRADVRAEIEELKSDLSDIKRYNFIKDEWAKVEAQMQEDQRYV